MNASKCCVLNCKNTRPDTIWHKFPEPGKELDRFNRWIYAIGGNVLVIDPKSVFMNGRVCHSHFDLKFNTASKRLSKNSVPSLFLSGMGMLQKECQETADLLMFFDDLFDSVNGSYEN